MRRILIIGATGFIGGALAQSLLRSGQYQVYGLARSPDKARQLQSLEIQPVLGSVDDCSNYLELIRSHGIDTVVDAGGANAGSARILVDLADLARQRSPTLPKLAFLYVSGTFVHGSSEQLVSDLTPVGTADAPAPPAQLVEWRVGLERQILAARDLLDVCIVRPALVYGRQSRVLGRWFDPIIQAVKEGKDVARIKALPESFAGLVHVDDVASGLHAAVDAIPILSGTSVYPVFDLVASREKLDDILHGAAKSFGFSGRVEYDSPDGDIAASALSTTFNGSSARAIQILGWQPRRLGLLSQMPVYGKAWSAHLLV